MIRNYFLTAWRNLKAHRLNAIINTAGLAIAFTVCILLFLMVHFEFSYDKWQKNVNTLYMAYNLSHTPDGDEKGPVFGYPAAPAFRTEVPGILRTTDFMPMGGGVRYKDKEVEKSITLVGSDFLDMFSFPVVAGNKTTPLADPGNTVLTQSAATAIFDKEDPIGKTIKVKIGGAWKDLVVTAIVQDAPENSTLQFNVLARIEINNDYAADKNGWNHQHHPVYVQLAPGITQLQAESNLRELVKKHHLADDEYMKGRGYRKDANGDMFAIKLAPYAALHFDEELGRRSVNKNYLFILILIAIVVLVIACFNFINLNVARAFTRAREVGVRKTIGAGKRQIFLQLWIESLLLFAVALIIAVGLAVLLVGPFNRLFVEKLTMQALAQPLLILYVLAGMLLVSFMAGGYPAWLVARFKTVEVLKGKVSVGRSSLIRNGLITFQFVMACLLICSTIVIYRQFQYMRTAPLGYEQESVISIPVKNTENSLRYIRQLRQQLASQPQVVSVTGSSANIGIGEDHSQSGWSIGFTYNGKGINTEMLVVDYDFLKTIGVKLLAGRDFSREFPTDTAVDARNVIVSESMARQFDEKSIVGLSFYSDSAAPRWNVIGVIPDIHLHSLHDKVGALTLEMAKQRKSLGNMGYIMVKVRTNNPRQAMAVVRDAYKTIEPDNTTSPSYLTENTYRWYAKEERLSTLFCTAAVIAIVLSCLGLFAIVSLVIGRRRKEIGVRKVLGASVTGITGLLSKEFIRLVALAFLIATPIAWFYLNKWLTDFPYRITLSWWVFPLAGVTALIIALGTISILTIQASLANPVKSLRTE